MKNNEVDTKGKLYYNRSNNKSPGQTFIAWTHDS